MVTVLGPLGIAGMLLAMTVILWAMGLKVESAVLCALAIANGALELWRTSRRGGRTHVP